MAIIRLIDENFERFELVANPERQFSSSSLGITGSVPLFADASSGVKDLQPTYGEANGILDDDQVDLIRNQIVETAASSSNIKSELEDYMTRVGGLSSPARSSKRQDVPCRVNG